MTRTISFGAKDFAPFYQTAIGIDHVVDTLLSNINSTTTNYPPYNIIKTDEDNYVIEIAVAGFKDGEIKISVEKSILSITAGQETAAEQTDVNFLHHGISSRKFKRTFTLGEYIEVTGAKMTDGILTINLVRELPEQLMPKTINVEYSK